MLNSGPKFAYRTTVGANWARPEGLRPYRAVPPAVVRTCAPLYFPYHVQHAHAATHGKYSALEYAVEQHTRAEIPQSERIDSAFTDDSLP